MFDNKYPYTDFHELNLDFILEQIKVLSDKYNCVLTKELNTFIKNKLHDLFVNSTYDASNQRLKLSFDSALFAEGDLHVYSRDDESISIQEEVCDNE